MHDIKSGSEKWVLKIKINKTKCMVSSKLVVGPVQLYLNNERVKRFKYFGCWIDQSSDLDDDIEGRIEIVQFAFLKLKSLLTKTGPTLERHFVSRQNRFG